MYLPFVIFRLLQGVATAAGGENVVVIVPQQYRDGSQNTWVIVNDKNGLLFRCDHHGATTCPCTVSPSLFQIDRRTELFEPFSEKMPGHLAASRQVGRVGAEPVVGGFGAHEK